MRRSLLSGYTPGGCMHGKCINSNRRCNSFTLIRTSVIKSPGLQEKVEERNRAFTLRSISKDPQVPFTCWGCPGVHTCWMVIRCFQKTFPSLWLLSSITCERNFAKLSFLSLAKVIWWSLFLKVRTVWRWGYTVLSWASVCVLVFVYYPFVPVSIFL